MPKMFSFQEQPFKMPGPNFNQANNDPWWNRHAQKISLALIVVFLSIGGYFFYQSYDQRQELLRGDLKELEQITASENAAPVVSSSPVVLPASTKKETLAQTSVPEISQEKNAITATAAKSNGKTHLARYALKEYLKDKPELAAKLSSEHLIYLEDWLQKQVTGNAQLNIGDQITFSEADFQKAIDKALDLSDQQLKNLSRYVPLVPSLTSG